MNGPETPATTRTVTGTPGQAAYERRQAAKARRMGAPDSEPDSTLVAIIGLRWEELPAVMQADEEAGALAAIAAAPQPDRAHRMAAALYDLADELDPDEDTPAPSIGPRRIAMRIRAAVREAMTVRKEEK